MDFNVFNFLVNKKDLLVLLLKDSGNRNIFDL